MPRTQELNFPCCSGGKYVEALTAEGGLREDKVKQKFGVHKSLGWSEEDVLLAFKKNPEILGLSEKSLRSKTEFLVGEVGLNASEIGKNANVLNLSLEKRLVPRNSVLRERKKLGKRNWNLMTVVRISEEKFVKSVYFGL